MKKKSVRFMRNKKEKHHKHLSKKKSNKNLRRTKKIKSILTRKLTPYRVLNSKAGEIQTQTRGPITRAERRMYEYEKNNAAKCIILVYDILGKIKHARERIYYLLQSIQNTGGRAHIENWRTILRIGEAYRFPNTETLKKVLMDPLVEGSMMSIANEAANMVKTNMDENIIKSKDPRNYNIIVTDIGHKILDVLVDDNYVHDDESGSIVHWREPQVFDILETLFFTPITPERQEETFSIAPIRAIREGITARDTYNLATIIRKAKINVGGETHIYGLIKKSKFGFPMCNTRYIPTLDKILSVYDKIFIELIPYLPGSMYREFHGVELSELDEYYHGDMRYRENEYNIHINSLMDDSGDVETGDTS